VREREGTATEKKNQFRFCLFLQGRVPAAAAARGGDRRQRAVCFPARISLSRVRSAAAALAGAAAAAACCPSRGRRRRGSRRRSRRWRRRRRSGRLGRRSTRLLPRIAVHASSHPKHVGRPVERVPHAPQVAVGRGRKSPGKARERAVASVSAAAQARGLQPGPEECRRVVVRSSSRRGGGLVAGGGRCRSAVPRGRRRRRRSGGHGARGGLRGARGGGGGGRQLSALFGRGDQDLDADAARQTCRLSCLVVSGGGGGGGVDAARGGGGGGQRRRVVQRASQADDLVLAVEAAHKRLAAVVLFRGFSRRRRDAHAYLGSFYWRVGREGRRGPSIGLGG
jgi:hypothetical protein